jgi:acyl-coenzyme A thioesterase PaaI-like protein
MSEATQLRDLMPFAVSLGIEIEDATAERVTGRLAWAPHLCTTGAVLHGGALIALADSLGGVCAYLNLLAGGRHSNHLVVDEHDARRAGWGGLRRDPAPSRRSLGDRG